MSDSPNDSNSPPPERGENDRAPARVQRGERFERWMRILSPKEYGQVYRAGKRARGASITVVAASNGLGWTRMGLSIGKRSWKRAVPRNRLRRTLREAFRLSYKDLPGGFDLILVGSTPRAEPELQALRAELVELARRATDPRRATNSRRGRGGRRGRRRGREESKSTSTSGPAPAPGDAVPDAGGPG